MRGRHVRGAVTELLGIARFKFNEGKREEYKRLSAQAMEIVPTKDSGTLQYDRRSQGVSATPPRVPVRVSCSPGFVEGGR